MYALVLAFVSLSGCATDPIAPLSASREVAPLNDTGPAAPSTVTMRFGTVSLPAGVSADLDELADRAGNITTLSAFDGRLSELSWSFGTWEDVYATLKETGADVEPSSVDGFAAFIPDDGDGRCLYVTGQDGVVLYQSEPVPEDGDCAGFSVVASELATIDTVTRAPEDDVSDAAWGTYVGSYNSVNAYSNGSTSYVYAGSDTYGIPYQCVHYANRYAKSYKGKTSMKGTGNANAYCSGRPSDYTVYSNGGTTSPATGDILVSKGGTYGHVGVVREVGSTYVKVIMQNWSNTTSDNSKTLSMSVAAGKYTVSGFSGTYSISCWVR